MIRKGADHREAPGSHRAISATGAPGNRGAPPRRAGVGPQPHRKAQGQAQLHQSQRGGRDTPTSKGVMREGHSRSRASPATSLPGAEIIPAMAPSTLNSRALRNTVLCRKQHLPWASLYTKFLHSHLYYKENHKTCKKTEVMSSLGTQK